jgi:hypothetical protein
MELTQLKPVNKQDIVYAIANALMRLGKNDWEGCLRYLEKAQRRLIQYLNENKRQ